jgi:hypothetical protein
MEGLILLGEMRVERQKAAPFREDLRCFCVERARIQEDLRCFCFFAERGARGAGTKALRHKGIEGWKED